MADLIITSIAGDQPQLTIRSIAADGNLQPMTSLELDGNPGPLAVSPDRRHLFASIQVDDRCLGRSYRIGADGKLRLTGETDMGANPCYLSTDNTGRYLLAAYYSDGMVTVDPIDTNGALGGPRTQRLETATQAHFIRTDASNRYAFVPHVDKTDCVFQFFFDQDTGQLTPNEPPRVALEGGQGPRHLCFHPSGRYAFTNGEQGNSVTVWDIDTDKGTLSPRQTLSTLPDDFTEVTHCSQLHLTPDGRFIYTGNRGHHSVAGFRVADDGTLSPACRVEADPNPRPMAISPAGNTFFAAGGVERLIAWPIHPTSGELQSPTYHEGGPISWLVTLHQS